MRRRWSIAVRLAAWLSAGLAIFWIGTATISTAVMHAQLDQAFDESLRQSAFRLLPLARRDVGPDFGRQDPIPRLEPGNRGGRGGRGAAANDPAFGPNLESFTYLVYDATGRIVVEAEDAPSDIGALPTQDGFSDVGGHRAFISSDRRSGLSILVLETSDARNQALWQAVAGLFWPLAALLPFMILGIWQIVRLALKPVERLSRGIAQRNSANLTPLDDYSQPTELAPIAIEVAGLLERLRSALEAERAFAASSAHELRTPVAGALAQTQRLAAELGDHPAAVRLQGVEASLRKLADLAERMLQLSRLEAGFARAETSTDMVPVFRLVLRDFEGISNRVEHRIDPAVDLVCPINPDAFALAFRNLLQNALLHGEANRPIEVLAGPGGAIRVRNHGTVVDDNVRARLSERFRRGATTAQGTGLGLAVVDGIMKQTGGRLVLTSPAPGWPDGFEAKLELGREHEARDD